MIIYLLQIPVDLHDKEFLPILQEEPLPPLALVSFTEDEQVGLLALVLGLLCEYGMFLLRHLKEPAELTVCPLFYLQRNFSMSVNSAAVLRLTGRGSGPIAGASRGRSTSRGRGKNVNFAVIHVVQSSC